MNQLNSSEHIWVWDIVLSWAEPHLMLFRPYKVSVKELNASQSIILLLQELTQPHGYKLWVQMLLVNILLTISYSLFPLQTLLQSSLFSVCQVSHSTA